MEKITFKNSRGLKLVGQLYPSDNGKIVILSHGWCSNKDRERFFGLADRVYGAGYAFLRFDQTGSGESEGEEVTVENYIDDIKSSIRFVKEKGYKEIGLIGESLGGLASLQVFDKAIKAKVLYAPVTHNQPQHFDAYMDDINKQGFAIKHKDSKDFKIPKRYIEERKAVNQKELLSKVEMPVLILHGEEDSRVPLENSERAMQYLPRGSKLEAVPRAEHDLVENYDRVINSTIKWFNDHM